MTTPKLDLAREWAERVGKIEGLVPGHRAATEVIQSLPDQFIDAKKVRELLHWREVVEQTPIKSTETHLIASLHALLTPSLPTLADLIEAGNDPEDYQWAWVDAEDGLQVISMAGDFDDEQVYTMDKDGYRFAKGWSEIRPRPDLPKLEWPDDGVEDAPVVDDKPAMPCLEDVPDPQPGEAWLIEYRGKRYEALFWYSELYAHWTFGMGRKGTFTVESPEATPIARLVPEVES